MKIKTISKNIKCNYILWFFYVYSFPKYEIINDKYYGAYYEYNFVNDNYILDYYISSTNSSAFIQIKSK